MIQTSLDWLAEVVGNLPVKARHMRSAFSDLTTLFGFTENIAGSAWPFTAPAAAPVVALLYCNPDWFSFGTTPVNSQGFWALSDAMAWDYASEGIPQDLTGLNASSSSLTETALLNQLFLLPAHGALTLEKLSGIVRCGVANGGNGYICYWSKLEVLVVSISADGTETTLGTITETDLTHANSTSGNYILYSQPFSADFGAGYAVAATARLGVRIKTYGYINDAARAVHHCLNATGGAPTTPTGTIKSYTSQTVFAFQFA